MSQDTINTKLLNTQKNTAVIEVVVAKSIIDHEREHSIAHLAEGVTLKGFRKGKAPLNLVEKNLDPQKIKEHTVNHILGNVITQCLKDHTLDPIGYPKVKAMELADDQDWKFEIRFPIRPKITLGDYKKLVKEALSKPTIILPGKEKSQTKEQTTEQKLSLALDTLAKNITFDVPVELIEDEVNHSLSRLVQQTQTLGISLEDYLKSLGKNSDQLKEDYEKSATQSLQLELILEEIAQDLKIEVGDKDVQGLATASGVVKQDTLTDSQKNEIRAILRRRKTIDALLSL